MHLGASDKAHARGAKRPTRVNGLTGLFDGINRSRGLCGLPREDTILPAAAQRIEGIKQIHRIHEFPATVTGSPIH